MSRSEFPSTLVDFIRSSVPHFSAVELLVLLVERPKGAWDLVELENELNKRGISSATIAGHLALFLKRGLAESVSANRYCYFPANAEIAARVEMLVTAYNERPVSLIRTIYDLADDAIRSFADSFKLKDKDKSP